MMSHDTHSLTEQLLHEILVLQARLNEIPKTDDQRSRYVTSYLENALAHRSDRLDKIVSPRKTAK